MRVWKYVLNKNKKTAFSDKLDEGNILAETFEDAEKQVREYIKETEYDCYIAEISLVLTLTNLKDE